MKNFELPLYLVANEERLSLEAVTEAHHIYNGLEEEEYHQEAPDLQEITAKRLFVELEGPTWDERRNQININQQVERLPKCLDIPLAFASDGNLDRAKWLLEDMIDQGILHESSSDHSEFFERADMEEEAFEQLAKAKGKKRQREVMQNLRQDN